MSDFRKAGDIPRDARIYVAGHRGLVGSAIVRQLRERGYPNIVTAVSAELDLREQADVRHFYAEQKPDYVFLAAARVGGILANDSYPAEFIYDNLIIESNVIHGAWQAGVSKLLFLGSTCIYPKLAPQPIKEEYLLTGPLEETNEWYAIAKIAGIKLCQAYQRQYGCQYISAMPTNLYGPGDNFDLESSHVMPAMIRKFHEAKQQGRQAKGSDADPPVTIWGTGSPRREFVHVDDCARACLHLMQHYEGSQIVNIGIGKDIPIIDLARLVQKVVGHNGEILLDTDKPDGTPRKLIDASRLLNSGWQPTISLEDGIRDAYEWFLANRA